IQLPSPCGHSASEKTLRGGCLREATPLGVQHPAATHLHRTAFGAHLPWRAVPGVQVSTTRLVDASHAKGAFFRALKSIWAARQAHQAPVRHPADIAKYPPWG